MSPLENLPGIADLSLTGPKAQIAVILALLLALALIIRPPKARRGPRGWFTGPVLVTGVVAWSIVACVWLLLEVIWRPFPEQVPGAMYLAGGVALHVGFLAVVKPLATRRRNLALTLPVALVAVVAALLQANITYQLYPTVATLDPTAGPEEYDYAALPSVRDRRDGGVVTQVKLGNSASGFAARDAQVYLPPAYFDRDRPRLPVIVLVHGVPGSPAQWFDEGRAGEALDSFAAAHEGRAPVVVAVDANGETFKDTLCADSPVTGDKPMTYLATDVPRAVKELFDVSADPAEWAIAGLSRGGSCALQASLQNPGTYPTFLAMSPQKHPVDENLKQTVDKYFRGDRAAYDAIDPLAMLERGWAQPSGDGAVPVAGTIIAAVDDEEDGDAGRALADAANRAGLPVVYSERPGGHTWRIWAAGFRDSLPWLSARLGLTGED
ncbi:alpha/beta hydrolase [Corynebacterium sp. NPDC060344]|uniref:alpha/beta hydrolase n=1 Tax=Corynebacterium sp. NPDC060344 TaxID=3347101 RepID=UPI003662C4D4